MTRVAASPIVFTHPMNASSWFSIQRPTPIKTGRSLCRSAIAHCALATAGLLPGARPVLRHPIHQLAARSHPWIRVIPRYRRLPKGRITKPFSSRCPDLLERKLMGQR